MKQKLLLCGGVFLCSVAILVAQTSTSQTTGTVRDASGGVIPGATVTATNEATGVSYRQNTTEAGLYAFPSVPVGSYIITAEAKGFRPVGRAATSLSLAHPSPSTLH